MYSKFKILLGYELIGAQVITPALPLFHTKRVVSLLSSDISTVITRIAAILADGDNNAPVYNTQGQRMDKPQRGINIYEGRKVVVK